MIRGLTAGRYYVSAEAEHGYPFGSLDAPQHTGSHEAYITTYYPGTPDVSASTSIGVAAGAVIRGIDLQMRKAVVYRVRGRVETGAPDLPPARVRISLFNEASPRWYSDTSATTREDGTFQIDDVLPGTYIVQTFFLRGPGNNALPVPVFANQHITVGTEDIEDLVVRLSPGVEVDGNIKIEDNGQQPASFPSVDLVATRPIANPGRNGRTGASFVIRNVAPVKYFPRVNGLPPGTYVKSVRFGGQDVTDKLIDLMSGAGGTLEIVLSPHAASVSGVLRNSKGDTLPEIRLNLWASAQRSAAGGVHASVCVNRCGRRISLHESSPRRIPYRRLGPVQPYRASCSSGVPQPI